jgi:acetyl-CoA carboxylase biotin carboxylase subunit
MIKRLLIANRGEIALRIVRACSELGIESVAVYSDADAEAPHVAAANRAVRIGEAPASKSYLSIPSVVDAALRIEADAVHPGYGFLAENAGFASACEAAHLTFVGPPASVIARMGSKIEARRLMHAAGVPIVPGDTPADQSDAGIQATIAAVGLPVLIKASSGGGGKGMRRVHAADEVVGAIQSARREAVAAFGDGTLYVERLMTRARHVEVQIFGDAFGHVVHLFERECSVQRRHQKVIEESPSPALTDRLRERMTRAATRAAEAVGYRNAGTVEFLLDASPRAGDREPQFYFLEMNTRLQVEHPVTELVTGLDLVHAQLLVAANEPLPWSQSAVAQRGHAIEARIYAEDPARAFLPQAGRILLYRQPSRPGVRVDSGIVEGSAVSVHYDPLLAKVIAGGESREIARTRLASALREFPILGVRTNIPYLLRILEHERFRKGEIDTSFLDEAAQDLAEPTASEVPPQVLAALSAAGAQSPADMASAVRTAASDPWAVLPKWRSS